MCSKRTQQFSLRSAKVFLLVFVQQVEQADLPFRRVKDVKIAESPALAFTSTWITYTCLPDTAKPRNESAPVRLLLKLALDRSQQFVCGPAREVVKPPGE